MRSIRAGSRWKRWIEPPTSSSTPMPKACRIAGARSCSVRSARRFIQTSTRSAPATKQFVGRLSRVARSGCSAWVSARPSGTWTVRRAESASGGMATSSASFRERLSGASPADPPSGGVCALETRVVLRSRRDAIVEISCQRGEGYTLVTPGGVGTPGDADTLYALLLESFADGADAVVCDVTCAGEPPELRRALIDAVLAAADGIGGGRGALLAVVGAEPARAAGGLPAGLVAAARVGDAFRLVAARRPARTARDLLEPLLQVPALARAFLRRTLAGWGADRFVDDALLVVDELVANAVLHAGTEIELRLALCPDRLGVAVADRSRHRPMLEHAD